MINTVSLPSFSPLLTPSFCLYCFSFSPVSLFKWIQCLPSIPLCDVPILEFFILTHLLARFYHQYFFFLRSDYSFWIISCLRVSACCLYVSLIECDILRSHFFLSDLFRSTLCPLALNVAVRGVWDQLDFFPPLKVICFYFSVLPERLNNFFFWLRHLACGVLVFQPGIEPWPWAVRAWSPNHWTTREFREQFFSFKSWHSES